MEITWSPQALKDIEQIGDFIAIDSPERAVSFVEELIDSVERLREYPKSGAIVLENPIFRHVVKDSYRLIYYLSSKSISIVTVLGPGRFCPGG